jgi:2-polyprenyl-3-methyl-5-hydroxy-6-metoxy-1,4-benzoquinol methylase
VKKDYIPHAWESVNCPFCNSNRSKLHEKFGPDLQYTYVKCLDCKLIYQNPRPKYDENFLRDAYEVYEGYIPDYVFSEKSLNSWDKELKEILRFDKKRTAILDIGSCMGDFLKVAQKYYSNCIGVDIAQNMAEYVKSKLKLKVYIDSFADINFSEKYSCVHMSHVIEHIPNPKEWLLKAKQILDEQGILALSVPNMNSLPRRFHLFLKKTGLKKGNWKDNSKTPDHLFEPTIPSMLRFISDNGYSVLEYYTYSRRDMDASTFFGKIYNRKLKLGSNLRFFLTPKQSNNI